MSNYCDLHRRRRAHKGSCRPQGGRRCSSSGPRSPRGRLATVHRAAGTRTGRWHRQRAAAGTGATHRAPPIPSPELQPVLTQSEQLLHFGGGAAGQTASAPLTAAGSSPPLRVPLLHSRATSLQHALRAQSLQRRGLIARKQSGTPRPPFPASLPCLFVESVQSRVRARGRTGEAVRAGLQRGQKKAPASPAFARMLQHPRPFKTENA